MKMTILWIIFGVLLVCKMVQPIEDFSCEISPTTASGPYAPLGPYCSGQLIFEEEFTDLNTNLWQYELSLAGGHNGEFQWYVNDSENSFISNEKVFLRPSLTADMFGEDFLTSGHIILDPCTDSGDNACEKFGSETNIINPIRSAKLKTRNAFQFKYGTVEVIAKNPTGDWLFPAIWLLPQSTEIYGRWPVCGEVDMMESRGNLHYPQGGKDIGVDQVGITLHWGPAIGSHATDAWRKTHYVTCDSSGFNTDFHSYRFMWSLTSLKFFVDDQLVGKVVLPPGGFWELGQFSGTNPWLNGTHMAPFDQEFYILLNLAVGGTSGYFPEVKGKPWKNKSSTAARDFWVNRDSWLPGWNLDGDNNASFVIESVRVWAL